MKNSLIIFGGTFDPFHHGHLYLATYASRCFCSPVRLLPNGNPPHRTAPQTTWQHRHRMCQIATANLPCVFVDNIEAPGKRWHYTINTLRTLHRRFPQKTLLLLTGADAIASFERWHEWWKIFNLAHIIVANRRGYSLTCPALKRRRIKKSALAHGQGGVHFWHCQPPAVAARDIRHACQANHAVDTLLPPKVAAYIEKHALYRQ